MTREELAEFLQFFRARLDEDELTAVVASPKLRNLLDRVEYIEYAPGEVRRDEEHIERHLPARVLAEVAAKRQVLTRYEEQAAILANHMGGILTKYLVEELLQVLRTLAAPYSDHPDYRRKWRP